MATTDQRFTLCETEFKASPPSPPDNRQWVVDAENALQLQARHGPPPIFSISKMRNLLDLNETAIRDRLYALFKHPSFHPHPSASLNQFRALTIARWKMVTQTGLFNNTIAANTSDGRRRYEAVIESCGVVDHSLDIKMSVHYGLFGATIALLGDDSQRDKWVPQVEAGEMLGCFALTELAHGSNARAIQTEAHYDIKTEQFVINTPSEEAQKYWIGGAYMSARWTVAFAQLYIADVCYGPHAFLVRLRNEDGSIMPGVTLADCGYKLGMNGVDNGRIWFHNVRVPREHMLRRHSQVSANGKFTSAFKSADQRFGVSMASLSAGRISVASGALNQAKLGLAITVRYALQRRAFGNPEVLLLDYPVYQRRIIPPLASIFVMQLVLNQLKLKWHYQQLGKELHVWSSGFKALFSWASLRTLQECREACGGQGYKSENRIGVIKNSHDVALTYEGDNHVLLLAVARTILPEFLSGLSKGVWNGHFAYLNDREALRKVDLNKLHPGDVMYALTIMRRREAAMWLRLSSNIQRTMKKGLSLADAFTQHAALGEDAARAHTELLVMELFHRALDRLVQAGEHQLVNILRVCGAMYVAKTMVDQPEFLRYGAISAVQAQKAEELVMELCGKLRPHVLHLVDSFGYPPHLLAPIAFDYVSHNSRSRL